MVFVWNDVGMRSDGASGHFRTARFVFLAILFLSLVRHLLCPSTVHSSLVVPAHIVAVLHVTPLPHRRIVCLYRQTPECECHCRPCETDCHMTSINQVKSRGYVWFLIRLGILALPLVFAFIAAAAIPDLDVAFRVRSFKWQLASADGRHA